jgi:hypothetical protein
MQSDGTWTPVVVCDDPAARASWVDCREAPPGRGTGVKAVVARVKCGPASGAGPDQATLAVVVRLRSLVGMFDARVQQAVVRQRDIHAPEITEPAVLALESIDHVFAPIRSRCA